jgi:hypothetical protein
MLLRRSPLRRRPFSRRPLVLRERVRFVRDPRLGVFFIQCS